MVGFVFMLALILVLAYAAVAAKLIAVYRIRLSFGSRFPALCFFLLFSALRALLAVNFSYATRHFLYTIGEPMDLALQCLAIVEIYRAVTRNHFPVRLWGTRFLLAFAAIGVCTSFLIRYAWMTPTVQHIHWMLLAESYTCVAMVVFLVLTCAFLHVTVKIPESTAATSAVGIMTIYASCSMAISAWIVAGGMRSLWTVSVAPAANGLLSGLLWATVFASASLEHAKENPLSRWDIVRADDLEAELFGSLRGRSPSAAAK